MAPLNSLILRQSFEFSAESVNNQMEARKLVCKRRREYVRALADSLLSELSSEQQYAMELAQERGASNWLTSLPIHEHGFSLHKGAFRDALALRYGWLPTGTPVECSCGKPFSVEHSLSCSMGGFPTLHHNEVRDFTASLMSEVCSGVSIEPGLQQLNGEQFTGASAIRDDGARLDLAANGFWGANRERAFFDVKVFNPYAPPNRQSASMSSTYRMHERVKKRQYSQRIQEVEHGTFTPLVMSLTGGLGREATVCYKRLASLLAVKWDQPYSVTMGWLQCSLSYSLL